MSRLVFTADVHLHAYRVDSRDGGLDRLRDGVSALRQTLEHARHHRCPWFFGGDAKVPRRSWPHDALTAWDEVLGEYADVPKVVLKGNHDGEGDYGCGLRVFARHALVVDRPGKYDTGESCPYVGDVNAYQRVQFAALPATAVESAPEDLAGFQESCDLLVGHGYVAGARTGPDDFRAPSSLTVERLQGWRVSLFGDIHKGQVLARGRKSGYTPQWVSFSAMPEAALSGKIPLRSPGPWKGEVYYPGSPYSQNWGEREDGQKGCLLVDLVSGEVTFLPVLAPRYVQEDWSDGPPSPSLRAWPKDAAKLEALERRWGGNFVRVVAGDWFDHQRELDAVVERVQPRTFQLSVVKRSRVEQRAEVHAGQSDDEMLRAYAKARPLAGVGEDDVVAAGAALVKEE